MKTRHVFTLGTLILATCLSAPVWADKLPSDPIAGKIPYAMFRF